MRKTALVLMTVTAVLAVGSIARGQQEKTEEDRVPETIETFYEDHCFIGSFSTQGERQRLVNFLEVGILPPNLAGFRLNEVLRRMARVRSRILRHDPEMIAGGRRELHLYRSAVVKLLSVDRGEDRIVLEVAVYMLEPEHVLRFIRAFESAGESEIESGAPGIDDRIREAAARSAEQKEFHIWIKRDGTWFRKEAKIIQLKH